MLFPLRQPLTFFFSRPASQKRLLPTNLRIRPTDRTRRRPSLPLPQPTPTSTNPAHLIRAARARVRRAARGRLVQALHRRAAVARVADARVRAAGAERAVAPRAAGGREALLLVRRAGAEARGRAGGRVRRVGVGGGAAAGREALLEPGHPAVVVGRGRARHGGRDGEVAAPAVVGVVLRELAVVVGVVVGDACRVGGRPARLLLDAPRVAHVAAGGDDGGHGFLGHDEEVAAALADVPFAVPLLARGTAAAAAGHGGRGG